MPTIRRCCIIGCPSNSRINPALQFFQFPKPENPFHKMWMNACHASLSRILPFKKPVVCALHFRPSCVGGRRLTSNAVPSLRLEIPGNMKLIEQQAMLEEIERSRKCAYINAVVYEWLVRANLNAQLRGTITHGIIKNKAEAAKQLVGCDTFAVDNRWLNRFRETHLAGFAHKLATNQLKPLGASLWIPDIVQDLQHLFPQTSAERMANFENVPEQYINYMQQYGEYEEDDDMDVREPPRQDPKQSEPSTQYQQPQHQPQHQYGSQSSFDSFATNHSFGMESFYGERPPPAPQPHYNSWSVSNSRSNSPAQGRPERVTSPPATAKRPRLHAGEEAAKPPLDSACNGKSEIVDITAGDDDADDCSSHYSNSNANGSDAWKVTISKNANNNNNNNNNEHLNSNNSKSTTTAPPHQPHQNNANTSSGVTSNVLKIRKDTTNGISRYSIASSASGRTPSSSPAPSNSSKQGGRSETNGHASPTHDLSPASSYSEALKYLRPIEQFMVKEENFRALSILAQLETILNSGQHAELRRNSKN